MQTALGLSAQISMQKARMNLQFLNNHVQTSYFNIITSAVDVLWTQD